MPKRLNKSKTTVTPPLPEEETGEKLKWLIVSYQPVSLFSLKRSDATSMAARSNLVPTPYSIKMALLKVLLEAEGIAHSLNFEAWIKGEFTWIRDLQIFLQPPERLLVNRNGYKLRYYDQTADKADKSKPTVAIQDGFVFREWVYLEGNLQICCGPTSRLDELERLLAQLNYFGKRGCFFQYLPEVTERTPQPKFQPSLSQSFTVQPMDDLGANTTFNKINPFSTQKAKLDKDRIIQPGFLPLELIASSARYDLYQRK